MLRQVLLGWSLACVTAGSVAQEAVCGGEANTAIKSTTSAARFYVNGEVAIDKATRLMWARCPLGTTWASITASCSDTATLYSWQAALQAAVSVDTAGYAQMGPGSGWRLPNIKELASIIERRCYNPAANNTVFPDTPPAVFWTNSPLSQPNDPGFTGSSQGDYELHVWAVSFGTAAPAPLNTGRVDRFGVGTSNDTAYVRLVRELSDAELACLQGQSC